MSRQVLHTHSFITSELVGFGDSLSFIIGRHVVEINHKLVCLMASAGKLGMLEILL